jgi:GTP cyclohydrolase FolE2
VNPLLKFQPRRARFAAQVSTPAVSSTSQSAGRRQPPLASLETRDTADLSVSASLRRDRVEAEGGEVCATQVMSSCPPSDAAQKRLARDGWNG